VAADGPYECVFIDGCHDYEVVVADIKAYLPLVKIGGYFVMDDSSLYIEKPYGQFLGHPDVSRAAKEYLTEAAGVRHIVAVGHNQVWQRVA
jgi:cephalosporin hydroxylase